MEAKFSILLISALTIGFLHTFIGPDHYLPFIAMSKIQNWPFKKTMLVTFLCGLGHIFGSVILAFAGLAFGIAVSRLSVIESLRGEFAGWFLLIFGFTYFVWGLHRAFRNRKHMHTHMHFDNKEHLHLHRHDDSHMHLHEAKVKSITPWVLFTIFVFGPCEALIPLVMYTSSMKNIFYIWSVVAVFGCATIITMLFVTTVSLKGLSFSFMPKFERYGHALAGFVIFACGISIKFLGL